MWRDTEERSFPNHDFRLVMHAPEFDICVLYGTAPSGDRTRVQVEFVATHLVAMPLFWRGLTISDVTDEDPPITSIAGNEFLLGSERRIYKLTGKNGISEPASGLVVACDCEVVVHDLPEGFMACADTPYRFMSRSAINHVRSHADVPSTDLKAEILRKEDESWNEWMDSFRDDSPFNLGW